MAETKPAPQVIREMVESFKVSQAIYVAVELGIPDLLGDGVRTSDDLAAASGAHPPTLYRLLRALASVGVLHEGPSRDFSLTPTAHSLRSDAPRSIAGWARLQGQGYFWGAWGNLLHSVRTGENAFRAMHGEDVWSYRSTRPELNAIFNEAMVSRTNQATEAILDAYDFSGFKTIVDIGGGSGALLAMILTRHKDSSGVVFDQPHVVEGARPTLMEAGMADRCTTVGGNMFESVPGGADAYTMKSILHDWTDEECVQILETVKTAMEPHAKLLILENIVGPPNEDSFTKLSDLNMLVLPGGLERTKDEWQRLLDSVGFRISSIVPTAAGIAIIECALA